MVRLYCICILLCVICLFTTAFAEKVPVIGILTQDSSAYPGRTYLFSSPVKYLEVAGAQIIPIFYKSTNQELAQTLSKINGVLFPGGNITINIQNKWTQSADFILKWAIKQNDKGNIFPIYGICQGHQLLSYLTSGYDNNMLFNVDGQIDVVNTVQILNSSSHLVHDWTRQNYQAVQNAPGILNYDHYWAVLLQYFKNNSNLNTFWSLVGTTQTIYGKVFTAAMQALHYPFYTVQFHAQSNMFSSAIQQQLGNLQAVQVAQKLILSFIQKAKLNKNKFKQQADLFKSLVYNYPMSPFNQKTRGKRSYLMDN